MTEFESQHSHIDDTAPRPALQTYEPAVPSRLSGWVAWLLVVAGALAWIVALAAVLLVVLNRDDDAAEPPVAPDRVSVQATAQEPVLGAATHVPTRTPQPTATLSATATATPPPTASPTMIPILTATPLSAPDTAAPVTAPTTAPATAPATAPTTAPEPVVSAPVSAPVPETVQADAETGTVSESGTVIVDGCAVPAGWERYTVQPGDTLFAFALGAGPDDDGAIAVTVDDLVSANCLGSRYLQVDQVLYLPPGAAENAPPSEPYVAPESLGVPGPRTPSCPCVISIPEGWRREQIAEAVQNSQTSFTGADFLAVTGPDASAAYDFVQQRPPGTSLEGFLFPGSYTVQDTTTAEQFRNMLLDTFAANVSAQMRADAAAQGVSFYEALVIASVVQREVRGPNTQKLVASVYYNNYRAGGRLGSTVTVQYAIGGPGAWWPRVRGSDLENPSPFNTYKYGGLPPAPIDSPGLGAITAAVYPAQTDYRFHTAACDGSGEVFAATYEEHLANVNCE